MGLIWYDIWLSALSHYKCWRSTGFALVQAEDIRSAAEVIMLIHNNKTHTTELISTTAWFTTSCFNKWHKRCIKETMWTMLYRNSLSEENLTQRDYRFVQITVFEIWHSCVWKVVPVCLFLFFPIFRWSSASSTRGTVSLWITPLWRSVSPPAVEVWRWRFVLRSSTIQQLLLVLRVSRSPVSGTMKVGERKKTKKTLFGKHFHCHTIQITNNSSSPVQYECVRSRMCSWWLCNGCVMVSKGTRVFKCSTGGLVVFWSSDRINSGFGII